MDEMMTGWVLHAAVAVKHARLDWLDLSSLIMVSSAPPLMLAAMTNFGLWMLTDWRLFHWLFQLVLGVAAIGVYCGFLCMTMWLMSCLGIVSSLNAYATWIAG